MSKVTPRTNIYKLLGDIEDLLTEEREFAGPYPVVKNYDALLRRIRLAMNELGEL